MTKRSFRSVKGQVPEYPKRSMIGVELLAGLGAAAVLAASQACGVAETTGGVALAPDAQIVDSPDAGQDAGTDAGEPETTGGAAPMPDGGE